MKRGYATLEKETCLQNRLMLVDWYLLYHSFFHCFQHQKKMFTSSFFGMYVDLWLLGDRKGASGSNWTQAAGLSLVSSTLLSAWPAPRCLPLVQIFTLQSRTPLFCERKFSKSWSLAFGPPNCPIRKELFLAPGTTFSSCFLWPKCFQTFLEMEDTKLVPELVPGTFRQNQIWRFIVALIYQRLIMMLGEEYMYVKNLCCLSKVCLWTAANLSPPVKGAVTLRDI